MKTIQVGPNSVHFHQYIQELQKLDFKTWVVSDELHDQIQTFDYLLLDFRSFNPFKLLKQYQLLKSYLKTHQPELIHLHQINRMAFFAARAAKKLRIPYIATAWGSDVLLMPQKSKINNYIVKQVLKNAKTVTADASSMIEAMQKLAPHSNKYHLLQYGIELVKPKEKEKIIFSNRLLKPLYRIDQIIYYFKEFSSSHKDWKLVIGGTGTEEKKLRTLVDALNLNDKVSFVGWLDKEQNHDWYSKSSIYISIPSSDGTSVSVLEAMSAGCIPVLANLKVTHEWIENLKNGIIENNNENPLVKALEIDIKKMQEINIELVKNKASRTNCIFVFKELYHKAISTK